MKEADARVLCDAGTFFSNLSHPANAAAPPSNALDFHLRIEAAPGVFSLLPSNIGSASRFRVVDGLLANYLAVSRGVHFSRPLSPIPE